MEVLCQRGGFSVILLPPVFYIIINDNFYLIGIDKVKMWYISIKLENWYSNVAYDFGGVTFKFKYID